MIRARKQLPKYCCHKPSGRAYVRIDGKMLYLGKHGSQASRREYDRIIAEFLASGRQGYKSPDGLIIENLILRYLDCIDERQYRNITKVRVANVLSRLQNLYGQLPITQFSPGALKTVRKRYIEEGLCRDTINNYIGIIKQVFSWGCEEEIVPAAVAGALRTVKALQQGRTSAPEYDDIQPVPDGIVEKTLPHIKSSQIQDMVRVQRLIGGRPQDVFNMRLCDIDRSGEIWKYAPFTHKTKKRGKIRELPIGPRAQAILQKYIEQSNDPEQFLFLRPKNRYYDRWYANAILFACKRAGVPRWTPNQLRHTAGTEIRNKFRLEYAQVVLGHANARTTEIYAKVCFDKAAQVAREIG
jgi:integrase